MSKLKLSEVHAINTGKADKELKEKEKKLANVAAKKPVSSAEAKKVSDKK